MAMGTRHTVSKSLKISIDFALPKKIPVSCAIHNTGNLLLCAHRRFRCEDFLADQPGVAGLVGGDVALFQRILDILLVVIEAKEERYGKPRSCRNIKFFQQHTVSDARYNHYRRPFEIPAEQRNEEAKEKCSERKARRALLQNAARRMFQRNHDFPPLPFTKHKTGLYTAWAEKSSEV